MTDAKAKKAPKHPSTLLREALATKLPAHACYTQTFMSGSWSVTWTDAQHVWVVGVVCAPLWGRVIRININNNLADDAPRLIRACFPYTTVDQVLAALALSGALPSTEQEAS